MKAVKLVHPTNARTITSEDDARRLRDQGWLELANCKSVNHKAEYHRQFRKRCREKGLRQLEVWLPEKAFSALQELQRPGENQATALTRLLCGDDTEPDTGHTI